MKATQPHNILIFIISLIAAITLFAIIVNHGQVAPEDSSTIYAVTNLTTTVITTTHIITNTAGFNYTFTSVIQPSATEQYHLRDMLAVPIPFAGFATIRSYGVFTATIIGYDVRPTPTPTNTNTPTPTNTSTPSPTPTHTPTPTPIINETYFPVIKNY